MLADEIGEVSRQVLQVVVQLDVWVASQEVVELRNRTLKLVCFLQLIDDLFDFII